MSHFVDRVFAVAAEPRLILKYYLARRPGVSFERRLRYDAIPRPAYGYGVYHAALQARELGIPRITAIELGVGPGEGLLALEETALDVRRATGVSVDVLGLDTGKGMPPPIDHRDLPYRWAEGEFWMNPDLLRARLRTAELILGDVKHTIPAVLGRPALAPIGFVSFDLDYYSSTRDALALFDTHPRRLLPRAFCHIDDVIGGDRELCCEYAGELLAIREFNDAHPRRKLAPIFGLAHKRTIKAWWNDTMHVLHAFDHPLYNHLLPTWSFRHAGADSKAAALREAQRRERAEWLASRE